MKPSEEKTLRRLLWLKHGCSASLYGDDGEMQCNQCVIDFKRDSVEFIERRFNEIDFKKMIEKYKKED